MANATTVATWLAALPAERRAAIEAVRRVVLDRLPKGFEETIVYGMIGYVVPLSKFSGTYNGQPLMLAGVASMKNYLTLHLPGVYGHPPTKKKLEAGFKRAGKKLDMGKGCVRFESADELALDAVGDVIASISADAYIAAHEAAHAKRRTKKPAKKNSSKRARA